MAGTVPGAAQIDRSGGEQFYLATRHEVWYSATMSWKKGVVIGVSILAAGAVLVTALAVVTEHYIVPESRELQELIVESESMPIPSGTVHLDIPYTTRVFYRRTLDIYEPLVSYKYGEAPLVVFFHGGSWLYGDKVTIRIIHRFLGRMRSEGYFVAAVNYSAGILQGLGGPVRNGSSSLDWLRRHALDYGFDPDNIGLYGVSAGGHVALMTEVKFRSQNCISLVLAECAPSDLVAMSHGEAFQASKTLARLPGKSLRRFSPVYQVSGNMAPVLIYHGDADDVVHVDQSLRLAKAIREAGGHAELEIYRDGTHAFLGMPDSLWYEQETRALLFMKRFLNN